MRWRRQDKYVAFGLDTFGDVTLRRRWQPLPQPQVLRNVVAEAVLADELGLDFFGIGEHHREDFAVSAPEVVLAAIAGQTSRIRLGSAVTVLSSDDPVRVFQRFSTLDAVSNGRAEVILGRGSFTESFPLFGFDLARLRRLFEEKLDLFVELLDETAGHLVRRDPSRRCRTSGVSADGVRLAAHVDRRRRQPALGCARRALRPADDAGDHRRRSARLRAARRPLPSRAGPRRP